MKMEMDRGDQVKPKETDYENSEVCGVRSSLPRKGEPTDHPPLTPANPQIPPHAHGPCPASTVEIEMMEGLGGKPIKVDNLRSPVLDDYTLYKSISNIHQSDEHKFSHSGTNGWVSWLAASSNAAKE